MFHSFAASFAGDAGDNFYVIDEGTFDVFIKKADVETKVSTVGETLYNGHCVPTNVNTQKPPACELCVRCR